MAKPRCGLPDFPQNSFYGSSLAKWYKLNLNYYFESYTLDIPRAKTNEIIANAFKLWTDVTQLSIQQVQDANANILIK